MSAIVLDEILSELYEAEMCMKSYKELDSFQEIFEAEDPSAQQQAAVNEQAVQKSKSHLQKACDAIRAIIKKISESIQDFFQKLKMDGEEKKAYESFKAACKQDPSLKNKKITVKDFRAIQQNYSQLIKESEEAMKKLKAGQDTDTSVLMKKITDFTANTAKGVGVAVSCDAALNMASGSQEFARVISNQLKNDDALMKTLSDNMGSMNAKVFKMQMNSLSKQHSLQRAIMKMKGTTCSSLQGSVTQTYDNVIAATKIGDDAFFLKNGDSKLSSAKQLVQHGAKGSNLIRNMAGNENVQQLAKISNNGSKELKNFNKSWDKKQKNALKEKERRAQEREKEIAARDKAYSKGNYSGQSAFDFITGKNDPKSSLHNLSNSSTVNKAGRLINHSKQGLGKLQNLKDTAKSIIGH